MQLNPTFLETTRLVFCLSLALKLRSPLHKIADLILPAKIRHPLELSCYFTLSTRMNQCYNPLQVLVTPFYYL